jgi:hypothetical protein
MLQGWRHKVVTWLYRTCWNNLATSLILERLRYHGSGLRVRVSPFCLPIFADVSIFTRNFYPFLRGKPLSTRKRQTGTGVFCLLFVGRSNSKNVQYLSQINTAHILVKVFNNQWRTSTAKVATLCLLWSVFSRRNILDFLSDKSFPDLRVRVRAGTPGTMWRQGGQIFVKGHFWIDIY